MPNTGEEVVFGHSDEGTPKGQGENCSGQSGRATRFSFQENSVLISKVVEYYDQIIGQKAIKVPKSRKKALWMRITDAVNAVGPHVRSVDVCKKRYHDIKRHVKKKLAEAEKHKRLNGKEPPGDVELTDYEEELRKILSTEITDDVKIKGFIDTGLSSEMFQDLMGLGASPEHTADSDFGSTSSDENQEIIVTKVDTLDIEAMSAIENSNQQGMLRDRADVDNVDCEPTLDQTLEPDECVHCQGKALQELGSSMQRLHAEVVAMNHMLDLLVANQEKDRVETARHREEMARYRASKLKLLMEANEIAAKRLSMESSLESNSQRQHVTLQTGGPSNLRKNTLRTRGGASASHARKGGKL
ncbi:uncharacterized protein LOC122922176 isoform X3 [Bufo gargarizans]|uniref:uncharacterized protein LOC122922176 isoform X3 n=1 Tax=Bufo gargarizans TaxID=30331 RepID=UPI001CF41FF8|nr:uncharacterized protein LOC122922176 isoform X3 [Bufo gargarizans]XP_044128627.1 uncharacterized protein LOC122922176 isoform X3 [Bufo gargarizans]